MRKDECKNCICLVDGENNGWICDQVGKDISLVDECPNEDYKRAPDSFYITIQEAWETVGNHSQIDENFVDLLYKRLGEVK